MILDDGRVQLYYGDCLEVMNQIPSASIDLILCDLPYGMTARNRWDTVIDPVKLWVQYKRIIKRNGAIVLFGSDKFTARMMLSNPQMHRYNLIWQKTNATGFLSARKRPLSAHEDIMVFYKRLPSYNPQKTCGHTAVHSYTKRKSDGNNYGETKTGISGGGSTERYPTSVLRFASDKQKCSLHPTQKPVALCEWLIKTYSNDGKDGEYETVLDNCMGSGTTGIAAINCGRKFIGIEIDPEYYEKAKERITARLAMSAGGKEV